MRTISNGRELLTQTYQNSRIERIVAFKEFLLSPYANTISIIVNNACYYCTSRVKVWHWCTVWRKRTVSACNIFTAFISCGDGGYVSRPLDLSVNSELGEFDRFRRSAVDRIIREGKKAVFDSFPRDFTDIGSVRKREGIKKGKWGGKGLKVAAVNMENVSWVKRDIDQS